MMSKQKVLASDESTCPSVDRDMTKPAIDMPMLPASLLSLVSISPRDPDYYDKVMAVLTRDPGLTVKAFQLANSVAFRGGEAPRHLRPNVFLRSERGWGVPGVQRVTQIYGMEGEILSDGATHSVIRG